MTTKFRLSHHLEPGDVIAEPGCIPVRIDDVTKTVPGFVTAHYTLAGLPGRRTYPEGLVLSIQPRAYLEVH